MFRCRLIDAPSRRHSHFLAELRLGRTTLALSSSNPLGLRIALSEVFLYDFRTFTEVGYLTKLSLLYLGSINLSARSSFKKRILLPLLSLPIVLCSPYHSAWITSSVQSEGLQHTATMSTAAANGGDDELRSSSQQSPLASQREKASNTPTASNRTGRIGGYFTLGYKEGFSQWVGKAS